MNFEAIPQPNPSSERPKEVEFKVEELMPTIEEMIGDQNKVEMYIDMLIADLKKSDPSINKLLSAEVGTTGKERSEGLKDLLLKTVPERLKYSKPGQDNELRNGLGRFIKGQLDRYKSV